MPPSRFIGNLYLSGWVDLLELDVVLRVTNFYEEFFHSITVVALQHDEPVFAGSTACTEGFEFLGDALQVRILVIHAIDDCC